MVKQFSLIEKELADGAKITEYNLHAKSDKYTVRIEKNSEKKTFPNISHAHLESLLKSQGHSFSPSLDLSTAINKDNYSITEYHLDSISNHFVVTVSKQLDSGIIDSISFPMITTAELAPLLQIPEEMVSNTVTLHLSFEQALSHGYNIEEYHSHQNNENYTVSSKMLFYY
ncbi:hypothetical protein BC833DRAFT_594469 [Globomyces pollinis-pini]|nr:hypothetical protein BC833DRAFT_594469 [Globomyces pollinis-pini]